VPIPQGPDLATINAALLARLDGHLEEAIEILGPGGRRIPHPRRRFGERSIDYRHYLRTLSQKPQAVRQVLPDLLRDLGAPFPVVWDRLETLHGPREAARVVAKILGQLVDQGASVVIPALERALVTGTPPGLAVIAHRATTPALIVAGLPASLQQIEVASGSAADYDAWLLGGVA